MESGEIDLSSDLKILDGFVKDDCVFVEIEVGKMILGQQHPHVEIYISLG